jgi:hypothetical protein
LDEPSSSTSMHWGCERDRSIGGLGRSGITRFSFGACTSMRESCRPRQYRSRAFRGGIAVGRPRLSQRTPREQALEGSGELETRNGLLARSHSSLLGSRTFAICAPVHALARELTRSGQLDPPHDTFAQVGVKCTMQGWHGTASRVSSIATAGGDGAARRRLRLRQALADRAAERLLR